MMSRRVAWFLGTGLTVATVAACTSILGIDPDKFTSSDAGAKAPDAPDAASEAGTPLKGYRDEVMSDGPVLYLRLGESGGAIARDEIDASNGGYSDGGITLGTKGALKRDPNTAMTLDGGAITMPAGVEFEGTTAFTAEVWFRVATYDHTGWGTLIDHERPSTTRDGWMLRAGYDVLKLSATVSIERARSGTVDPLKVAPAPPVGSWHHLVGVFDGKQESLFIDGTLQASKAADMLIPAVGGSYTIGQMNPSTGNPEPFIGDIDEVAIYDKALSQDRIQAHYDAATK
jgi:hypothetical protein